MDDFLNQLLEASVVRKSSSEDLVEIFEGSDGGEEVLEEATLAKLGKMRGFPSAVLS